jgi:hypothetical protein
MASSPHGVVVEGARTTVLWHFVRPVAPDVNRRKGWRETPFSKAAFGSPWAAGQG